MFSTSRPAPSAPSGSVAPASPEDVAEALAAPAPAIPHDAPMDITTTAAELAARAPAPFGYFRNAGSHPNLDASLQAVEYHDAAFRISQANLPPGIDPEVALVLYRTTEFVAVREFARVANAREALRDALHAAIRDHGLANASPGPSG